MYLGLAQACSELLLRLCPNIASIINNEYVIMITPADHECVLMYCSALELTWLEIFWLRILMPEKEFQCYSKRSPASNMIKLLVCLAKLY